MTTLDTTGNHNRTADRDDDAVAVDGTEPAPRRRHRMLRPNRRHPAPRAHPFWRFVFPAVVIGAGVTVFLLWLSGTRTVLDTPVGHVVGRVLEPDEPGYEAFVQPTPTILVAHTHDGDLTGVTFLAQTNFDEGGGAVLLPADLLVLYGEKSADGEVSDNVEQVEQQGEFLGKAWAEGGLAQVELLVENLFGFGFDEVIEFSTENLAAGLGTIEPIPFLLFDDLNVLTGGSLTTWLSAGRLDLDADVAARLYGFRNPDEAEANRVERQRSLWTAWLESINRAPDPDTAVLPFQDGIWPFLRSLGLGSRVVEAAPLQPVVLEGGRTPFYVLDDEGSAWIAARAAELVPRPITARSFVRPTVRLLDGIGDPTVRDSLVDDIVAAGGVMAVIGNAAEFGVIRSVVAYHRSELADAAGAIGDVLGVEAVFVDDLEPTAGIIDITITVGFDQVVL